MTATETSGNMPDVSVVMSVYNARKHLSDAIEGILDQEGISLEFIIVDDGSSDGSSAMLDEYARRDRRIRLIRQQNTGLTKALIRGCAEARASFVARQDADDVSLPGRLAAQAALLRRDDTLAFVSCGVEVIGPRGEVLLVPERPAEAEVATSLFRKRMLGPEHGSVMFRKDRYQQVGGYRAELYYAQDNDLWLRLATVGRLAYAPGILYKLRISPDSISGRLHPVKVPFARVIDELHEARLAGRSEQPILEKAASLPTSLTGPKRTSSSEHVTSYFIARCLMRRADRRALSYVVDAIRKRPLYLRAWLSLPSALWLSLTRTASR